MRQENRGANPQLDSRQGYRPDDVVHVAQRDWLVIQAERAADIWPRKTSALPLEQRLPKTAVTSSPGFTQTDWPDLTTLPFLSTARMAVPAYQSGGMPGNSHS